MIFGNVGEELQRFPHGHLQDFVDVLSLVQDLQHGALVAHALAVFADQFDVGEELHFDSDRSVAFAGFAASAWNVEGEASGVEAMGLRFARGGEDFADIVEGLDVGDGIRARSPSDRALVDEHRLGDPFVPLSIQPAPSGGSPPWIAFLSAS